MSRKLSETAKMGHNKTSRKDERPCKCGQLAGLIMLHYWITKSNGSIGEKHVRLYAHPECV